MLSRENKQYIHMHKTVSMRPWIESSNKTLLPSKAPATISRVKRFFKASVYPRFYESIHDDDDV